MSYRTWTATFTVGEEPDDGAIYTETLLDGVAALARRLHTSGVPVTVTMTDTHGENVLGPITPPLADDDARIIHLGLVADALARRKIKAIIEMTGGGVATLFAGPTHQEPGYGTRYAAVCGPGYFAGPNYTLPRVVVGDIFVGPDGPEGDGAYTEPSNVDELVDAIVKQVNEGSPRG